MFEKYLQSGKKVARSGPNAQIHDNEGKTTNKLSPFTMGRILNSSNSSAKYEDTECKQYETKIRILN